MFNEQILPAIHIIFNQIATRNKISYENIHTENVRTRRDEKKLNSLKSNA